MLTSDTAAFPKSRAEIGNTPMVAITVVIQGKARIVFLKLEGCNQGGSSKDRTARFLIDDAEAKRRLRSSSIVVESTSGNLGVALSLICRDRRYPFVAVVDPKVTPEKIRKMHLLEARIELVDKSDEAGNYLAARIDRVRELCRSSERYVWLDQYSSPANPLAHYMTTGPEIQAQMKGNTDALFIAVSTGGTLAGIGRYFREVSPRTVIVAVDAVGSVALGGRSGSRLLTGIGSARRSSFVDESHYDLTYLVTDAEAFLYCRSLFSKTSIKVGGSSGAVLAACVAHLTTHPDVNRAVCLCPDDGNSYDTTLFSDAWLREKGVVLPDGPPVQDIRPALLPCDGPDAV